MKRELSFILAAATAASLAGCTAQAAVSESAVTVVSSTASAEEAAYSAAETVTLTFSDSGISGSGSGVEIDGTALTISAPGCYLLTGSCADGMVKIKKGTSDVTLILSNLNLTSSTTAPIVCGKSSTVTILAAEGTDNTLTDAAQNNDTDFPDNTDAENAVLKCKDGAQVVLGGSGSLTVNANGKNGIKSGTTDTETGQDAALTIRDLTLTIHAPVNDAVNAEQLLNVESGTLTIDAADDALHCDLIANIGAAGTAGPAITITGAYEGIEAATLSIASGDIDITCTDDCLNAGNADLNGYAFTISISGGTIRARSTTGDGFDSNDAMTISGGDIAVWTANTADNQPLDADGAITVTGGTVLAAGGSGGMGMSITAEQAYLLCGSSGRGGMGGGQRFGEKGQRGSDERPENFDAAGTGERPTLPDGADSTMTTPQGEKPQRGAAMAQDGFDNTMAPQDGADGQTALQGTAGISLTAGSDFTLTAADGSVLYTGTAVYDASYLFFTSASITADTTYTLMTDSGATEVTAQ